MKDDSEAANNRRSKRQRVPNSFYTDGINELKRAPRPARDPPKAKSKKTRQVPEEDISYMESYIEEERSEVVSRPAANPWLPCRLPSSGTLIKVQFLASMPEPPQPPPPKKEEPAPKPQQKKVEESFNLLSLFQEAIKNVADQPVAPRVEEIDPAGRQIQILRKRESLLKQRRSEVQEDRITTVEREEELIKVTHSTFGQVEIPVDVDEGQEKESLDSEAVSEVRQKLEALGCLRHISLFS